MKAIIGFILTIVALYGSEYASIQPSNLIADFDEKGVKFVYEKTIKLTYDAANPLPMTSSSFDRTKWYIPNTWHKYKTYYPPGTGLSNLQFIAKTNSSYRIHLTFKGDDSATINHYAPISSENQLTTKATTEFLATNGKIIEISNDMINNSNGGWLYIDIVEDANNIPSYYGDVNPYINMTAATLITDTAKYAAWRQNVEVLSSGSPGDAVSSMRVIDKTGPTTATTRSIAMDMAIDPTIDKDGDSYSPAQGDCNDYSNVIYPGRVEIPNDGIDQNCDGVDLIDLTILDQDNDKYTPAQGDCNDYNSAINPGASAIPSNGINDNCANAPDYEYVSLHPNDLLTDLVNKFSSSSNVVISKNVSVSRGAIEENGKWYAPSWHSYKFFIPKGLDSARITASSGTTSADYRIHATFKANHNATISHATPVQITNPIANKETVQVLSDSGVASLVYDPAYISAQNGGYVYLDIVENPGVNVNPTINLQLSMSMADKTVFNSWKDNVNVLYDDFPTDGQPEDDVAVMTIIDRSGPDQTNSRTVQMGRSTMPWSLYANVPASSSSSSVSSSGSSSSCFWWQSGCSTSSATASSVSSVYTVPSSAATSSTGCFFWEAGCTSSSSSSSSYYYVSSTASSSNNAGSSSSECFFWQTDCTSSSSSASSVGVDVTIENSVVKDALSGQSFVIPGVFSAYDFDEDGTIDPFDWVYKDSIGYAKLRGNSATETNVFGWKDVDIDVELTPNWYLFPLGSDIDGDGSLKFDWIIVSADSGSKQVYKLSGVSDKGTFRYSEMIDLDYSFSEDRNTIDFVNLRPGE